MRWIQSKFNEGWHDLNDNVAIIVPDDDSMLSGEKFKTELANGLKSIKTRKGKDITFKLVDAETQFSTFPTLNTYLNSDSRPIQLVIDTISNQDGLEYDAAIVVGFGVEINEIKKELNKDKSSIYRAITRARELVAIVNEPVK